MSRGFEPSQGSPSRGRSNATGIAVTIPSAPRVCRPVARRSSCHRMRSLVERFFPDPVITRRTQVRVSSRPSRASSVPAATTVPRSDRPRGAGIASRSRRETPKRLNRTVARMAQIASAMPTAGNTSTNSAAYFCCSIAALTPSTAEGTLIRFQSAAKPQAPYIVVRLLSSILPAAQSGRHSHGVSGLFARRASSSDAVRRALIAATIPPMPTSPNTSPKSPRNAAFRQSPRVAWMMP